MHIMTEREIDNIINKYNKRAEAAAKALGTRAILYQNYVSLLSMLTGGNMREKKIKNAKGEVETIKQAKRGRTSVNKILTEMVLNPQRQHEILKSLARQKTVGKYLQDIKVTHEEKTYKGKKISDLRDDELKDYARDFSELFRELTSRIDEVYEVIGNNLDDFKTYSVDELQKMVDKINEAYDNTEFFDEAPEAGMNATDIPY